MLTNLSVWGCGRKLARVPGLASGPFWGTGPNSGTLFQLVTCPSGRRCNTRNVVWCKSQRGFKSHRHRHVERPCFPLFMREAGPFALSQRTGLPPPRALMRSTEANMTTGAGAGAGNRTAKPPGANPDGPRPGQVPPTRHPARLITSQGPRRTPRLMVTGSFCWLSHALCACHRQV